MTGDPRVDAVMAAAKERTRQFRIVHAAQVAGSARLAALAAGGRP